MTDNSQPLADDYTLGEKQELFSRSLALLLQYAFSQGYDIRMGAVERLTGGHPNSLHKIRLAADLHLFRDGIYLDKTEDHKELGRFWESLSSLHAWGGHFGDGNHYSIRHGGMR